MRQLNQKKYLYLILIACFLCLLLLIYRNGKDKIELKHSPVPTNLSSNADLSKYLSMIKEQIKINTSSTTHILVATLEALHSTDLYSHNNDPFNSSEFNGPSKLEMFTLVKQELMKRGGDEVFGVFEQMLVADILKTNDKKEIRDYILEHKKADVSFSLQANDTTQNREYLLQFDPKKTKTLKVQKGTSLLKIAEIEYPKLSKTSGVEIICFTNNLPDKNNIIDNQTLQVFEYKVKKNNLTQKAMWEQQDAFLRKVMRDGLPDDTHE